MWLIENMKAIEEWALKPMKQRIVDQGLYAQT